MIFFAVIAIPIVMAALKPSKKSDYYQELYRLEDPDRYTPGEPQFSYGQLVITPGAEDVLIRAEDAVTEVTGRDATGMLIKRIVVQHTEGDWGEIVRKDPEWASDQDKQLDSYKGLPPWGVTGIHSIAGTEVWVKTIPDPAGNMTTLYLPSED
jgi:hypothetical protein